MGGTTTSETISPPDEMLAELDQQIDGADPALSPADLSLMAIRTAQRHAGSEDPFVEVKKTNNALARSLLPELEQRLAASDQPLWLACILAACGNIIDLGTRDDFDLHETIEKVIREGFRKDEFDRFVQSLDTLTEQRSAPFLLYVCDNAGEIVFDQLFICALQSAYPSLEICAVVRQSPVLNDATMDDAVSTGLTNVCRVIDNGNDRLGTVMSHAGDDLREAFSRADIMISKGQANYETLSHRPEPIFFILKAKCNVIAASLGVELLDAVMTRSPHAAPIHSVSPSS